MITREVYLKKCGKIGAIIGFVLYLIFGFMPGITYGKYGAHELMHFIFGEDAPTLIKLAYTIGGIYFGVVAMLMFYIVFFSLIAVLIGYPWGKIRGIY